MDISLQNFKGILVRWIVQLTIHHLHLPQTEIPPKTSTWCFSKEKTTERGSMSLAFSLGTALCTDWFGFVDDQRILVYNAWWGGWLCVVWLLRMLSFSFFLLLSTLSFAFSCWLLLLCFFFSYSFIKQPFLSWVLFFYFLSLPLYVLSFH